MKNKKVLKTVTITLLSLFAVVMIGVAIALNFVFTPDKITPMVNKIAQKYVKSDISIGKVDLTFFSTFPYLSADIDSLQIKQEIDSLSDFITAEKCSISINPLALLGEKIDISRLYVKNADITVLADSTYSSFDLFVLTETAHDAADSIKNSEFNNYSFDISGLELDSTTIMVNKIDDNRTSLYEDITLKLDGNLNEKIVDLDFYFNLANFEVVKEGETVLGDLSLNIDTEIKYDRDSIILRFDDTKVVINEIALTSSGYLKGDTISKTMFVDVNTTLTTPSLSEFLNLVPTYIMDSKDELKTKGDVNLAVNVKGTYGDSIMPDVNAKLLVNNGYAKYESRKLALENVNCDIDTYLNFNNPIKSYAKVNRFHIAASDVIDLDAKGQITRILNDPFFNLSLKSDIDFGRFTEIFPLQEGVELKGVNKSDLEAKFALSDVETSNYGKMYLSGESVFNDLYLSVDGDKMSQDSTGAFILVEMEKGMLEFGNNVKNVKTDINSALISSVDFSDFGFKDKDGNYALIKKIKVFANAAYNKKTKKITGIDADFEMQDISTGIENDIDVDLKSSKISLTLLPADSINHASLTTYIQSDSITAFESTNNSDVSFSHAKMNMKLVKLKEKRWTLDGEVGFSNCKMFSNLFPLNIEIPSSNVTVKERVITLNNTHLKIGNSDIIATGNIKNLIRSFFRDRETRISGDLNLKSRLIDVEELILATNKSVLFAEDSTGSNYEYIDSTGRIKPDSLDSEMVLVPKNINFNFNLDLDNIKYGNSIIDRLKGRAKIKNGVITFNNIKLNAIGAHAVTTIIYKNISKQKSNIYVDLDLKNADINKLGNFIPAVDTLMPMLKSFEGMVDFDFKAVSEMNSDMTFDMPTLKSAMSLDGQNMVVMDGETFTEISKSLKFKNRDRNLIDSLNVLVTIENSHIDVLPFEVTLDRYRFIIGGTQTLTDDYNLNFNYNVSIMKSPLPFKAGVDIFGNLDNYDYKITKAKLKKTDFELQTTDFEEFKSSITK